MLDFISEIKFLEIFINSEQVEKKRGKVYEHNLASQEF